MPIIEQMELVRHRSEIIADLRGLVEKYRAIFAGDACRNDQSVADKLIFLEFRSTLAAMEEELSG